MKIFIAIFEDTMYAQPYVYTYADSLKRMYPNVTFGAIQEDFWTDKIFEYDIVHVMWPNCFASKIKRGYNLVQRIQEIKDHQIPIVATCHNLHPHDDARNSVNELCYDIVYRNCEVMIHLGETSKDMLQDTYKQAHHVIIPHHVYDEIFTSIPTREDSVKMLHLKKDKTYILAFGAFRSEKERNLIRNAARKLNKNIVFLAPSFYQLSWSPHFIGRNSLRKIILLGKHYFCHKNIIVAGKRCSDQELKYYYGASKIAFIQRTDILNSGNVPMAYLMGRVVVGPNTGNIAELLQTYGNPIFNPMDIDSVMSAIKEGLLLAEQNKGKENRDKALFEISSANIAKMHYQLYKSILRKHAN